MSNPSCEQASSPHKIPRSLIAAVAVAGLGLTLALYLHGVTWWYAPVTVAVVSAVGHLIAFAGVGLLTRRLLGRSRSAGGARRQGGELIHRPRLYDLVFRVLTLGREKHKRGRWAELAGIGAGDSVLDVGCGTGSLLLAAAERVGPTGSLHGIEPAPEMVAHARDKASEQQVEIDFTVGSADALPYPDASVDVALCTLVLHHLPPELQRGALREMRRVLKSGGRALVVDLHREPGSFRKMLSVISILHGGCSATVVDVPAELEALGFGEVGEHPGGSYGLSAILGRVPEA